MRLVQKNLKHTGYAVFKNKEGEEETLPTFSNDPLREATFLERKNDRILIKVYGSSVIMKNVLSQIKEYKEKYGVIPQDLTEELRTGFSSVSGLQQSYPRYYYK